MGAQCGDPVVGVEGRSVPQEEDEGGERDELEDHAEAIVVLADDGEGGRSRADDVASGGRRH